MRNFDSINIGFVGDVAFTGVFAEPLSWREEFFDSELKKKLLKNDFNVINLEGPLSNGSYLKTGIKVTNPPNCTQILTQNKLNIFNLANNHILDLGEVGLVETLKISDSIGAKTFGLNKQNVFGGKTLYIEKNNIKIALIGVLQHYSTNRENDDYLFTNVNENLVFNEIKEARKNADHVILNYHGYEEYTFLPFPRKVELLRKYIDFGADIIIAHHPHVVQGYEKIEKKYIFYSLGNFIFDIPQHNSRKGTDSSILLNFTFTKNSFKYYPCFIDIDKKNQRLTIVENNLSSQNFSEIDKSNFDINWRKECHRLLFIDSQEHFQSNLEKENFLIKNLKYYFRIYRLIKSYYFGKEAYRPILKEAVYYILNKNIYRKKSLK